MLYEATQTNHLFNQRLLACDELFKFVQTSERSKLLPWNVAYSE